MIRYDTTFNREDAFTATPVIVAIIDRHLVARTAFPATQRARHLCYTQHPAKHAQTGGGGVRFLAGHLNIAGKKREGCNWVHSRLFCGQNVGEAFGRRNKTGSQKAGLPYVLTIWELTLCRSPFTTSTPSIPSWSVGKISPLSPDMGKNKGGL